MKKLSVTVLLLRKKLGKPLERNYPPTRIVSNSLETILPRGAKTRKAHRANSVTLGRRVTLRALLKLRDLTVPYLGFPAAILVNAKTIANS